tara:strand:+ start:1465 stop:1686 length:222 start_codon:yes stop_codon:yes gene_type:complete
MIVDTIELKGLISIKDVEYKGNFTINYKNKDQLKMLQLFFGVRRSKFDMELLEKRPELLKELKEFNYAKNLNR